MELKEIDKKLLAYLYQDARTPASRMAKALHLTREQVTYRIHKYEQEGIIKGYLPLIKYSKLGYPIMTIVMFKAKNARSLKELREAGKNHTNRINTAEVLAQYDLATIFVFQTEKQRNEKLAQFMEGNAEHIENYQVLEPYVNEFYPLKFLTNKTREGRTFHEGEETSLNLDEKESKILKYLSTNAHARIIDIAGETKLSAELIVYKLKKLKEKGVLIGTRAYFDMQKIGFFYTLLFMTLPHLSEKTRRQLSQLTKKSKNIESLTLMLGKPNCYLQVFHSTEEELRQTIADITETFKETAIKIEILPLKNEGQDINTLPFL